MEPKPGPRSILNLVGFIAFVLFSCAGSLAILVITSIVITRALRISLIWAIPISLAILVCLALLNELGTQDSTIRSKLPKRLQRTPPEHIHDVHIIIYGTVAGAVVVYALTRSTLATVIVGIASFVYFYRIQSAIRWSRSGLKFIPNWHAEQQEFAKDTIHKLRSDDESSAGDYCLFLRPFGLVPYDYNIYRDEYIPLEELVAESIQHICPVVAVGRELPVGPGYISTEDWQADVALLIEHAAVILVLPAKSAGMAYEINYIIENFYLQKTLFVGPPAKRNTDPWETEWEEMTRVLEANGLKVPTYRRGGSVIHYPSDQHTPIVRELSGDIRRIDSMSEFISSRLKSK